MKKRILLSAVSILAIASVDANAAGFQLGENSTVSIGRAFAGAGVVGDDLSAIALNPAGMSLFNGTVAGQVGVALVDVNADFTGTVTNNIPSTTTSTVSENPSTLSAVPHTYVVGKVNDKINIGLGIHTPFGLETDYPRDWAGAFMGVKSYVMTVDINPTISYKINNQWSVGLGLSAQYLAATLTSNNVPGSGYFKVDGSSWAYGYDVGVMYEPIKDTRIGLSYRSKMDHDVEGDTYNSLGAGAGTHGGTTAEITLPETVTLSGFHKLNEKFGLSTTFRWTNWSRFEELTVMSTLAPDTKTEENWRNTWSLGFGVDYYASPDWTLRFGIGYDKGPIKSEEFRTPRIPDNDRLQFGLGASWKYNENVTFDLGYMYLHIDDASMNHDAKTYDGTITLGNITGTFEPYSHILSASVQVKF